MADIDIAVDFMGMVGGSALWASATDVRPGLRPEIGRYVVVADDDADPAVARIVTIDESGNIELEVLPGSVESHQDLLART
ncbi:MAG: hypothetical protein H0U92_08785 [Actinobacteria bacterium]|nr:hypothetical protein [Actinomycetota bacterium]